MDRAVGHAALRQWRRRAGRGIGYDQRLPVANGTLTLYVNGVAIDAPVSAAETAASVATALQAAITAVQADLGVTAIVDGGNPDKIDITVVHKGLDAGNTMDLRTTYYPDDAVPAGLAVAIVAMAGGTANPVLTTALANLGNQWFTDWILPYTDGASIAAVTAAVESLWGPMAMQDARVWDAVAGTVGTLATFGAGNDEKLLTTLGVAKAPQPVYLWAAVYGAVGAYNLVARPGAAVAGPGAHWPHGAGDGGPLRDAGPQHAALDGIATFRVDEASEVLIERAITTYRVNASSVPDPSYLDIETLATLAIPALFRAPAHRPEVPALQARRRRHQVRRRRGRGTPSVIRNELIALASEWEAAALVEDISDYKTNLIVERDTEDVNRVNALLPPNIINQLRVFAGQVAFIL